MENETMSMGKNEDKGLDKEKKASMKRCPDGFSVWTRMEGHRYCADVTSARVTIGLDDTSELRHTIAALSAMATILERYRPDKKESLEVWGISKPCHGDKYDRRTGEEVAYVKAMMEAYDKLSSNLGTMIKDLNLAEERIGKTKSMCDHEMDRWSAEYAKYCDGTKQQQSLAREKTKSQKQSKTAKEDEESLDQVRKEIAEVVFNKMIDSILEKLGETPKEREKRHREAAQQGKADASDKK